ncbi:MAG TPA: DUF3617 domain-containing protein [Silvibacterium sp.]|nr:DUF3617 domain-containing protein [Silvibacterium sp.]
MTLYRFSIFLIALCAASVAGAQTAATTTTPPPIKMGLWETSVTTQMEGLQLPPEVIARLKAMGKPIPGDSHTNTTQGCMTPDEWQKNIEQMNQPKDADCTYANRQSGGSKYGFDISCKSENGMTMNGHFEMLVDDTTHAHGSFRMKSDQEGQSGQKFSMHGTLESKFLGSDCGDVKPGSSKTIKE